MEPEFGVTVGVGKTGRPKPSLPVRLTEMAGMAALVWGIAAGPWWLIGVGAAMVIGSYALYRRKHGLFPPGVDGPGGFMDDGGGD